MFHTTVKCVDCGALMVDVPSNTKRCAVCRVGHNRESVRKANEAERARLAAEAAKPMQRAARLYGAACSGVHPRSDVFSLDNKERGRQKLTTPEHTPTVYHDFCEKSRRTHNGTFDVEP